MAITKEQRTAVGITGLALFLLFLNLASNGVVNTWFQTGGSFVGRWIVPTVSFGMILYALRLLGVTSQGWLVTAFVALIAIDFLFPSVSDWFKPRFDPETGKVQTMMDSVTGDEFANLSPAECATRQLGYCINTDTGQRLIAWDADLALDLQTENQPRRLIPEIEEPIVFPTVDNDGCTGNYASQVNCKRVTLHETAGSSIDWVVDRSIDTRSRCIQFNPSNRLQTSPLRNEDDNPVGTTFTFTGHGQMTYTIFEVPVGQTGPGGARCGS